MEILAILALAFGPQVALGQLAGTMVEGPPPVTVAHCTKAGGCVLHDANATMDANWRWIHGVQCSGEGAYRQCSSGANCYTSSNWDKSQCPDPKTCAENCALEAITAAEYSGTYGVSMIPGGVKLKFMTGQNAGSRLYLTEGDKFKLFRLKNREFSFDVDVSELHCGLNGAVYFSEMAEDGGKGGRNKAGARFGTGYCDAQCPHDVKFMDGLANILEWNQSVAFGKWGACCAEMDIWEANREATAFTTHPCNVTGTKTCTNRNECGGFPNEKAYRYKGFCDKDGCDFNSFRNGEPEYFGKELDVDSEKPMTIVTQWITDDGTDDGELAEIRRLYVQDGKVIKNSVASALPGKDKKDDSITEQYCDAQKKAFGDPNEHKKKGGLKAMGEALDRGVVLVVSLWDDKLTRMRWLDSYSGNKSKPGKSRGPCKRSAGDVDRLRNEHGGDTVSYTNFMFGELDTTYTAGSASKPEAKKLEWKTESAQPAWGPVQDGSAQPAAQPAPAPGPGAAFSQCGGKTWGGDTKCQPGCKCVANGDFYSQCQPPEGAWTCGMAPTIVKAEDAAALPASGATFHISMCAAATVAIAAFLVASAVSWRRRGLLLQRQQDQSEGFELLRASEDA